MRVERKKPRGTETPLGAGKRALSLKKASSQFQSTLLSKRRENLREELFELMGKIDAQAKELEKTMTFEELDVYKELVRDFIHIAVGDLYEVEEKISVSRTGKRKAMLIVKKIDEELEKMTGDFIGRQINMLNFMGRLDEIRGLLMDLYT